MSSCDVKTTNFSSIVWLALKKFEETESESYLIIVFFQAFHSSVTWVAKYCKKQFKPKCKTLQAFGNFDRVKGLFLSVMIHS